MITTIFTAIPLVIGVLFVLASIWEYMSWQPRFTDWRKGMATSLGAIKQVGHVGPQLAYEYEIDGVTYEGTSSYMRNKLPSKGDSVSIYYDPDSPDASEWYNAGMHNFFMFAVAPMGALLIWVAISAFTG